MPIEISQVPRTALQQWLGLIRLPLTAVTRLARRTEDETWPPTLAFDAFEAQVKGLAGNVLHDDELRTASELGHQRVARLRDAEALESAAERRRVEADNELDERRQAAQQRAEHAEDLADERQQQLEAQEAATKRRVREDASSKKQQANKAAKATQKRIDDQARRAEQKRLQVERDALAERRKAVKAKGRALNLDKATTATRQRRKARS